MTAEIAILNRSAIAFAADSAVTISVDNKTKVYDTAEKLFEFSKDQPIGVMIYNNVEFVGVPMDVLIRKFRAEKCASKARYDTMTDASDQFVEYLKNFDHDVSEERAHLYAILREKLKAMNRRMTLEVRKAFRRVTAGETVTETPDTILLSIIKQGVEEEQARALPGFLSNVTLTQFRRRYGGIIELAAKQCFKPVELERAAIAEIGKYAFALVKSNVGSDLLTGLVFGGFAEKDMFPTLRYMEIDGIYFNELKILNTNEVDIDRKNKRAEVVPFAQKEMVERFMYGLDADLEADIRSFVGGAISEVIKTTSPESSIAVSSSLKRKVNTRFAKMISDLKQSSRQDLLDIVYFMSKKELADIAYALVELTSQKRRFSTDEQTVGGPIDVAILTKNEGFVWIRRKHYFDSEINPGYRSRVNA
jgi:hypothetical protein